MVTIQKLASNSHMHEKLVIEAKCIFGVVLQQRALFTEHVCNFTSLNVGKNNQSAVCFPEIPQMGITTSGIQKKLHLSSVTFLFALTCLLLTLSEIILLHGSTTRKKTKTSSFSSAQAPSSLHLAYCVQMFLNIWFPLSSSYKDLMYMLAFMRSVIISRV